MGVKGKAPTETGQGWEKSAGNALFAIRAVVVNLLLIVASIGRAGGRS